VDRSGLILTIIGILCIGVYSAEPTTGDNLAVTFATVSEGKDILTARDDFVERLSPFDRAARMKTDQDVSEKQFLEFIGQNVLAWTGPEKKKVTAALEDIKPELESMSLPLPKRIYMVKTSGKEEGGAAYTRANAIVLPKRQIGGRKKAIQKLICHELFHILSRANPELKERLYRVIGFEKCNEIEFPAKLKSRKITNPDAPKNDHCIRLQVDGKSVWAIPILFSKTEKYDPGRGGEFFRYLVFRLLLVERSSDPAAVKPVYDGPEPKLVDMSRISGFFEQVGKNTGYIIHPEEILADNFALLVLEERNMPSPEIIRKVKEVLKESKPAEPGDSANADKPIPRDNQPEMSIAYEESPPMK